MWVGQLDRRITIEAPTITQDAYGAAVTSWRLFAVVWANMQDTMPSRSEAVTQGVLSQAKNQTRIRFRYISTFTSAMRIVHDGVTYNVVGGPAEIGGRKEYIEIVVEEFSS